LSTSLDPLTDFKWLPNLDTFDFDDAFTTLQVIASVNVCVAQSGLIRNKATGEKVETFFLLLRQEVD
jgi:hypothetical protein